MFVFLFLRKVSNSSLRTITVKIKRQISHQTIFAGGAIYSSELLLNGIVKQKLEYERYFPILDFHKETNFICVIIVSSSFKSLIDIAIFLCVLRWQALPF